MKQTLMAFLFGFLVVTFIIWMLHQKSVDEPFTTTTEATTPPFQYREYWLANVPATRSLKLYLSSSSDIIKNYTMLSYDIPNNKWRNFVAITDNDADAFSIQKESTVVLQPILNSTTGVSLGFPTKDVILYGPYSYLLSPTAQTSTGGWLMPSFTLMTHLKLNALTERVELFKIHADYPYTIKAFVDLSRDANNAIVPDKLDITMVFGENQFIRQVPLGTLLYTGATGIFLTFVYNETNKTIHIYVGKGDTDGAVAQPIPNPTPIPITGSKIEVNSTKKLDAVLFALLYFTSALSSSEIDEVQTALLNEFNGSGRTVAKAVNITTTQTTTLQNTIQTLETKLEKCVPISSSNAPPSYFQIDPLGINGLSAAQLKACSAFDILKHPLLSTSNDIGRLSFTARPSIMPTWIQYPDNITTDIQNEVPRTVGSEIPRFLGTPTTSTTTPTTSTSSPTASTTTPTTSTSTTRPTPITTLGTNTRRGEFGISTANPIQVINPEAVADLSYEQQRRFIIGQEDTSVPLPTVLPSPSSGRATNNPTSSDPVFLGNFFDDFKNSFKLFTL